MPDPFVPHNRFVRALLATYMVAALLVTSSVPSVATAQTEAALDSTPIEISQEPLADTDADGVENANGTDPIPTPTPTPISPTPTPTQAPTTVPPTLTPVSTTPTPTQAPTEVPLTPTPVPPTQESTDVSPTPAPTQTPTPVSPTPTPTTSGGNSVQRIVTGSGCTQVSSTDIVPVGTAVEFRCDGAAAPLIGSLTRTFSGLTPGWQYQVNNGPWRDAVGSEDSRHYVALPGFTVRLRPTAAVDYGRQGTIAITVDTRNLFGGSYTATLGAIRHTPVPTAADLQLVCNPVSVSADVNASQIVTCTYSGRPSLNTRQITLTRITVPVPAGWSIASPVGSATATTLTILPNTAITYSGTSPQSYTFSYTLTPACTAPTTAQPIDLRSTFSFNATTGIAGATFSQVAARSNTSSLEISVRSNSVVWNEPYSLVDSTVRGSLIYQVVANGCSGWNMQVSASPYQYTGPNNGTSIPASNLSLTATGNPIVVSGESTGLSRQAVSGPIDTPLKVMSATAGSGNGVYQQQLEFNLTIPGRSLAGTYQSTITVTSAAAP